MKILVLGGTGFLGGWAQKKAVERYPECKISSVSLSSGVDLRNTVQAEDAILSSGADYVINCAAYVGGIQYGYKHPAELFTNNLRMITNVFEGCVKAGVKKLIQPISNCAYPAEESFFQEENFWNGPLHESIVAYGMTRKMMVVGAWSYLKQHDLNTVSLVLSNMYGPGDHYDIERSHALGALIKRIVDAKEQNMDKVVLWGSGKPVREWMYVEDGAEALVRALDVSTDKEIVNVGQGKGISISELAEIIKDVVGWDGVFEYDTSMPDGAAYKTVDGTKGRELLDWEPTTELRIGIENTVKNYLSGLK